MRKLMVVLVAVLGLAGVGAVASAHMRGGEDSGSQGYGPGYGGNCGMGPGWMSQMGRMSRMGRMSDGRMPYRGCGWYPSARGTHAGPDATNPRHGAEPDGGQQASPGNPSRDTGSGR